MAYAHLGRTKEAWTCLEQMEAEDFQPDSGTFVSGLKACSLDCWIFKGQQLHIQIVKGGWDDVLIIVNSLIDMYAKCGKLEEARKLLDLLSNPDLVSWTALISGYAEHSLAIEALDAYKRILTEGLYPDDVTFVCCLKVCGGIKTLPMVQEIHLEVAKTGQECKYSVGCILVDVYAKCGLIDDAKEAFDKLPVCSVVAWTALIAGYAEHGGNDVSLKLFHRMQEESVLPNVATYTCILGVCGNIEAIDKGHYLHAVLGTDEQSLPSFVSSFQYPEQSPTDCGLYASQEKLAGALVDMYSRCGHVIDAKRVFDTTSVINLVTCNSLILGCSRQGENTVVFGLLQRMNKLGIIPDGVTYVALLTACSHGGLVEAGHKFFEILLGFCFMEFTVEHCNCMIDLSSRAGQYDKALGILNSMPFQPNLISFGSMFGVCRRADFLELGKQLLHWVSIVGRNLTPALISMSNIYAAANMHADLEMFREILEASISS